MIDDKGVDCSKIKTGMVVKNYIELCNLLGEKVQTSNSKVSQMKRWSAYFRYEKQGHRFHILEVYQEPLDVIDKRRLREGKYLRCIEPLIVNMLQRSAGHKRLAKISYFILLGMVREEYAELREKVRVEYCKETKKYEIESDIDNICIDDENVDKEQLLYFIQKTDEKLREVWNSAIGAMEKRNIICVRTEYLIFKDQQCREATGEESSRMEELKTEITQELRCPHLYQAYSLCNKGKFFKRLRKAVKKEFDCDKVLELTALVLNKDFAAQKMDISEIQKLKMELGNIVAEDMVKRVTKDRDEFNELYSEIGYSEFDVKAKASEKILNRAIMDDCFVEIQRFLINSFIKTKAMERRKVA